LNYSFSISQKNYTDSIINIAYKQKADTSKVIELNDIAMKSAAGDNENAMVLAKKALDLSTKIHFEKGVALVYKTIGIIHFYRGENDKAFEYFYKSLDTYKKSGDKSGVARSYVNIGVIYRSKQDYTNALKSYNDALEVFKETSDKEGIAVTYLNIGSIYHKQGNYKYALENYFKSREFFEQLQSKSELAKIYSNIGGVYASRNEKKEAKEYFDKAYKVYESIKDTLGMADVNNNVGFIHLSNKENKTDNILALSYFEKSLSLYTKIDLKDKMAMSYNNIGDAQNNLGYYDKAFESYNKSLEIFEGLEDSRGMAVSYSGIGEYYYNKKNYKEAIKFLEESKKLVGDSDFESLKLTSELLSSAYYEFGDYKKAVENHILFKNLNDSIFSKNNEKAITELSMQYEFDKQKKIDEIAHKEEIKRQNILIWSFTLGFVLMIVIAIVLIRGYRIKTRANKLLSAQKKEIESKNVELGQQNEEILAQRDEIESINEIVTEQRDIAVKAKKEITDSITYALRIQEAVLPHREMLMGKIPDYFILFRPRDIVSGDFYWMTEMSGKIIIAAADCTGHGVPGAFMSMLGVSFLNEIVIKDKTTNANQILNSLRDKVIESLHQKDRETKDGMDISLTIIDPANKEIQYSGAYNSLYIISDSNTDKIINTIKGDRMPIGIHMKEPLEFTNHTYKYKTGDSVYMMSDGYIDQFGGKEGRKLKIAKFQNLLLSIQNENMQKQKIVLNEFIETWMGDLKQIDDILVIGMKL
jgi:tetratricopeptide (TPR) repeat protein